MIAFMSNLSTILKTAFYISSKNKFRLLSTFIIYLASSSLLFIVFLSFIWYHLFIDNISNWNEITIDKVINTSGDDVFKKSFVDKLNTYSNFIWKIRYDYVLKIPVYWNIKFLSMWKFDTDLFLTVYDFNELTSKGFENFWDNSNWIWIILPSQSISLIKTFLFDWISWKNLKYLGWDLSFWKSTFLKDDISKIVSTQFHINGLSDKLPIYALAIDKKDVEKILLKMWSPDLWDYKIHWLRISFKDTAEKQILEENLEKIWKDLGYNIIYSDSGKEAQEISEKYSKIICTIWIPILILIILITYFLFFILLKLKLEENKWVVKTLSYMKYSLKMLSLLVLTEPLIIFISVIIIMQLLVLLFVNSDLMIFVNAIIPITFMTIEGALTIVTLFIIVIILYWYFSFKKYLANILI